MNFLDLKTKKYGKEEASENRKKRYLQMLSQKSGIHVDAT
jgi:hypothetical protein